MMANYYKTPGNRMKVTDLWWYFMDKRFETHEVIFRAKDLLSVYTYK